MKNGSAKSIRELRRLRAESEAANDDSVFGLTPDSVGDRIKATLAHAGIDSQGVSAHALRRAHATELATRGRVSPISASRAAGSRPRCRFATALASPPPTTRLPDTCRRDALA